MPITIDVSHLFQQFLLARLKIRPYHHYNGWGDERLWFQILEVVNRSLKEQYTMHELLTVFKSYESYYKNDFASQWLNQELRSKLEIVFNEKWEDEGVPIILNSLQWIYGEGGSREAVKPTRERNFVDIESLSSYTKDDIVWEESFTGRNALIARATEHSKASNSNLAAQFCKDMEEIGISPFEAGRMSVKFPPDSYQYMVADNMPDRNSRLEALKGIYECFSALPSESSKELSNSTPLNRKNKRKSKSRSHDSVNDK